MRRVLLPLLEKTKEVIWRAMMVAEEEDVDVAVEDSVVEVDSVAVEVSVELVSVEVIEVVVEDSVVTGEGSVVAAGLGEPEEDSGVEEVDSVVVTTEERAAPNFSQPFRHHKFFIVRVLQLLRLNFFFSSSNNILLAGNSAFIANDQML